MRNHYITTVAIFPDGDRWAAILGESAQDAVAGTGTSVNAALLNLAVNVEDAHHNWLEFAALRGDLKDSGPSRTDDAIET
jgi:hypothetical protein